MRVPPNEMFLNDKYWMHIPGHFPLSPSLRFLRNLRTLLHYCSGGSQGTWGWDCPAHIPFTIVHWACTRCRNACLLSDPFKTKVLRVGPDRWAWSNFNDVFSVWSLLSDLGGQGMLGQGPPLQQYREALRSTDLSKLTEAFQLSKPMWNGWCFGCMTQVPWFALEAC